MSMFLNMLILFDQLHAFNDLPSTEVPIDMTEQT